MKVNVACAQMEPVLCDVRANLSKMEKMIGEIMAQKPETDLIVFPELATSGYECGERFEELAELAATGPSREFLSECAKKYGVCLVYGFPERDPVLKDVLFNSSVFIERDGRTTGVYRKVHLFDSEKKHFRPGCGYPVFQTSVGCVALMICWDTAFPEVARSYALKGAQLIVVSTNWEKPYEADWDLVTRARAFDNITYIAAANRVGFDKTLGFFGRSKIVDPLGRFLAELNEEREGFIEAQLDYDTAHRLKTDYYTLFKDRRPDTYDALTERY